MNTHKQMQTQSVCDVMSTDPNNLAHGGRNLIRELHHLQGHQSDLYSVDWTVFMQTSSNTVRISNCLHLQHKEDHK